jgi:hypothetical protein
LIVEDLVHRARRRFVINEALSQLAFAACVTMGGLSVVLILGTRYLDWWSLVPVAAAGLAIGAVRTHRATPNAYATAVRVDRNAGLQDALSTAWHFSREKSEFPVAQRLQAEAAARRVDLDQAVPFTLPRSLYFMAGLTLLASGLVGLRFYSMHGLDLRPPLTEVLFEDLAAGPRAKPKQSSADLDRRKRLETAESLLAKLGIPLNPEDQKQPDALDKAIDQALDSPGNPGEKPQKGEGSKPGNTQNEKAGDPLDDKQAGQNGESKTPDAKDGSPSDKAGSKNGGDSSSLLSKLKDAVSNMLSKVSEKDGAGQKGQPKDQGSGAKQEKGAGQKSANKGQEKGQNQSGSEEGEPNGDAQQGQQAEGKAGAKSAQQSSQAGNGVGSQDGAKDLRAAEQLKAMGKISEIIGKRAATVSGETTIEVQSGKQQLRTAYSNKTAAHGETDSGASRDEIPVALQSYVQQYFEQVRKSGAGQKTKPADKPVTP